MTTLRDPFDHTYEKGGFTYVSWSQVADRLDEAAPGWSFRIVAHGDDWVHGRLELDGLVYENIGYAENASSDWKKEPLKDAVSDALKRCAALAGVGRYLYDKETHTNGTGRAVPPPPARPAAPPRSSTHVPDLDDPYGETLDIAPPHRAEGTMWSKDLFDRVDKAGIDRKDVTATAKKMFGQSKWKVTDLTDGERFALAVELGLA